jgi:hypothetical protein
VQNMFGVTECECVSKTRCTMRSTEAHCHYCYLNNNQARTAVTRMQDGHPRNHGAGDLAGVQTSTEAHPVSCSACIEGSFSDGVKWPGCDTDHSPALVPMLRMSGDIPLFPIRSHGMQRHNIK